MKWGKAITSTCRYLPLLFLCGCFHADVVRESTKKELPQTIQFSGYDWLVKSSSEEVGPGPNYFSAHNVRVDSIGALHLRVDYQHGHWQCAEVYSVNQFGYGTFKITSPTNLAALNKQVVLGFFLYDTCESMKNHEIDVEFSRWGTNQNDFGQYAFHGRTQLFKQSFGYSSAFETTTHLIIRLPESISFRSTGIPDSTATPDVAVNVICQHTIQHPDVIYSGAEPVHLNLWLYEGKPLESAISEEVVIQKFEFDSK